MKKMYGLVSLLSFALFSAGCVPGVSAEVLQARADGVRLVVQEVLIDTAERVGVRNPGSGLGYVSLTLVNTGPDTLRTVIVQARARGLGGASIVNTTSGRDVLDLRLSQVLPPFDLASVTLIVDVAAASGRGVWGPFSFEATPVCLEVVSIDLGTQGILTGAALQRAVRGAFGNLCR
jgi:hypothetical protein